jgi:hypothetical protein
MKRDPFDVLIESKTGNSHELSKPVYIDALALKLIEIDARFLEQIDAVLGEHILPTAYLN